MEQLRIFINSYVDAFKKMFDYRTESERYEYNYFFLFSICFFILLMLIVMFVISRNTVVLSQQEIVSDVIKLAVSSVALFKLVHVMPFLAITKRRINKIFEHKSNLFFGIYMSIIILLLVDIFVINMTVNPNNSLGTLSFAIKFGIFELCSLLHIGFVIFLMSKKKPIKFL